MHDERQELLANASIHPVENFFTTVSYINISYSNLQYADGLS